MAPVPERFEPALDPAIAFGGRQARRSGVGAHNEDPVWGTRPCPAPASSTARRRAMRAKQIGWIAGFVFLAMMMMMMYLMQVPYMAK